MVQLLTVGTWGRPAAYSRYFGACAGGPATYIGAESTVSTQGQGSSCLQ